MKTFFSILLVMLCALLSFQASATIIRYEAIDLADTGSGDLWQYRYQVSDRVFAAGQGFSIFFDRGLYEGLADPPPAPNGNWDVLSLQPDPLLPDDGLYDGLALVDNADLGGFFILDFIWLGAGRPGSQRFEVYTLDTNGVVTTIETGVTIPLQASVPEPGTMVLLGIGLLGLAVNRRRRGTRPGWR